MLMQASGLYKVQSASDTFPEELVISNWYKHQGRHHDGEKVDCPCKTTCPSTSIECCELCQEKLDSRRFLGPWSLGTLIFLP